MKNLSFTIVFMLLLAGGLSAQIVNKDSLSLVKKIEADKEKLATLKSSVPDAEDQKRRTADRAQESADDNRKAASKLSDDPQDRQLARKASNAADDAKSDSRKARKAVDHLEGLNRDIRDLAERIDKEQSKLNKYIINNKEVVQAAPVQASAVRDSTHIKD
jgi:hypothetical protein